MRQNITLTLRRLPVLALALLSAELLSGCLVAGYSSRGGWFVWPGSFGLLVVLMLLVFLLRRRR